MSDKEDFIGKLGKSLDARYAQLARDVQRLRTNRSKAQPVSVERDPTGLGEWGSLVESVAVLAAETAGVPGAAAASKVIQALIGIEDAQAAMLKQIRRDVELLRLGPFRAAREQLAIACRKGPLDEEYGHHLREAEGLLIQAIGQAASIEEASVIRFNLGLVAAVRGDEEEARYRLKESYDNCVSVTEELISRSADVKVFKRRSSAAVTAIPYAAPVVAARKYLKAEKAHNAALALESYVPFVNAVAQACNQIERAAMRPGIRLQGNLAAGYELEWIHLSSSLSGRQRRTQSRRLGNVWGGQQSLTTSSRATE